MMKTTGISIVAAVFWAGCAALHAQSLSWDTDPAVPGAQGGTGNWVGPNFWLNGASNQTWSNLSQATFGGTAGTVTVNAPVTVAGMTFNVEAYTINGASTLTLANPVIDVATPVPNPDEGYFPSAVISAPIGGTQGLVKNGLGILVLSGSQANTFIGTTFINAGALDLWKTAGTPGVTGDLVIGDNIGGPRSAGVDSFVGHQIADGAKVTVNADGYWYLGGNAPESINTLELNGGSVFGSVGLTALKSLANAAPATIIGSIDLGGAVRTFDTANGAAAKDVTFTTINSSLEGITNGGVLKSGAGTLEITGPNTFTTLQIDGGTITVPDVADAGIASPLGIGSNISFGGGTLEYAGGTNDSTNRAVTLNAGGGHFRTAAGSGLLSLTGVISGSGGLTTDGFIELTALNTFTGPLDVVGGITIVPGVADSGVASPIGAGGAITLNNGALILNGPLSSATNRPISISNGSSLGPGTGTVTFSGPITGSGLLGITGPGILILSGNNTFEGDLYIVNTFLRVANGSAVPDSATVTVSDHPDAALQLNGSNETIGALTGGGASGGNITLGSGTLTIGANNTATAYDGVISGTGGITKIGSGDLTLSRASSFSGTTTIQAGSVSVADVADSGVSSPLGTNAFMTLGAAGTTGTLVYTGASDDSLGRTITLNGNGGAITVSNAAATLTIAGQISGSGGLRVTGPGAVVVANFTTYSGATIIGQGTLRQSGGNEFSEKSAFVLSNAPGSVLDLNNINASLGSLAGGGPLGGTVLLGNTSLGAGADNTSTTFSGTITGTGGFVKTGAGTMKLNGTNTYIGVTNVSAGRLQFSGGNAIADTSPLLISANATAEFLDSTETVASLLGTGTVALSGGNMNIGADNFGTFYDGVIAGTGNLTKVGSGNLRLSKPPTYTGSTSLNGGGLALEGGFETAGASITVATGANLQARGVVNRPIAGSGTITATGTLTIGDGNSISGFNFGGTLAVGTGQVTLSDANMADLGTLTTLDSGAQLGSTHGIRVAAGRSVLAAASASATIAGTLLNNGSIAGPTQSGQALSLTGDVTGAGGFQGMVRFTKSFNPGTGSAAVSLENFALASTNILALEIGGLAAGTQYDRLNFTGSAMLGGTLAVTLINGFTPAEGNSFLIINGATLSGAFDSFSLPNLNSTLAWRYSQTPSSANLIVVPEPSSSLLLSLTLAVFLGLRRRLPVKPGSSRRRAHRRVMMCR